MHSQDANAASAVNTLGHPKQTNNWRYGYPLAKPGVEGSTNLLGYDRACLAPALELYINGCVTLPDADILLHCGLAYLADAHIPDTDFAPLSIGSIERTYALSVYLDHILTTCSDDPMISNQVISVLQYTARDIGQGVGGSRMLIAYAYQTQDFDLLSVIVDSRTRQRVSRKASCEFHEQEQTRLRLAADWSPVSPRRSASILHRAIESSAHVEAALQKERETPAKKFFDLSAPMTIASRNYLNHLAGL